MGELIDITGMRFGRLVVIDRAENKGDTRARWHCICDCGGEKTTSGKNLRTGITQSCGCLGLEWAREMGASPEYTAANAERIVSHGHKRRAGKSPEYRSWLQIKRRCSDPTDSDWPNYGAIGIRVCPEWEHSFEQFLADMGEKPTSNHVIVRKDTKIGYSPDNCEWLARQRAGARRRRSFISVSVAGLEFPSIKAACRHFGVNLTTVLYRIHAGIPLEDAVTYKSHGAKPRRSRESYLRSDHPDRIKLNI
ncbi:hypothetical protein [Rhizobium rhizogenes]|uniref:hypothetical protein n=1 Tax=Rhizobium rhizogenes TaxID=359 RepID=UPI000A7D095D|nr:hypothetical protein [Rhizobium rhizogenes]NTI80473.1 hypothetical protein [Rhizobium rhizogenes]NTJ22659.1 hypothetical protein [Rhizobium rhizogenes]QUE81363.1 hypothetical protein EML492_06025 [Rhizobium rhizogenes]TQO80542.1 hypothetical protein FFE80_05415 [Rhizobium rhizogenes]TRB52501.1 hypothetical protein EXN69_22915 [Rhizobium rhizogenes]